MINTIFNGMGMAYLMLLCLFVVAFLYASIGHGGASGYLAIMSLFGIAVLNMKMSVLLLDVLVAFISFYQFYKGGFFKWTLFWPFAVASVPAAFPGSFRFNYKVLRIILGVVLFSTSFKLLIAKDVSAKDTTILTVEGSVNHPLNLSKDDINHFKNYSLLSVPITTHTGRIAKQFSANGILLRDVLDSASVKSTDKKQKRGYTILLTAKDGYKISFSWNEIYNTMIGDSVFLLFPSDKKILEEDGPWILVSLCDKVTGPRYIKWLKSIEIEKP